MASLYICVLFVLGGSFALPVTEVSVEVPNGKNCSLREIKFLNPTNCTGQGNGGLTVTNQGRCNIREVDRNDGILSPYPKNIVVLTCQHGYWSGTDSSVGEKQPRHKRLFLIAGLFLGCFIFCGRGGGGGGGGTTVVTKYPPSFSEPCKPLEVQENYNVLAGESGAVVAWNEPVATDQDGGAPSVTQVAGGVNGGQFEAATYGRTHYITYKATDSDGLTGHCHFSFTVTTLTCSTLPWPDNGARSCENDNILGSSCHYTCDIGYQLSGNDTVTCQNDTSPTWTSNTTCEKIRCNPPSHPENGSVQCSEPTYQYQSICQVHCNDGFSPNGSLFMQCQADGSWSNEGSSTCKDGSPPTISCLTPQIFYADRAVTSTSVNWREPTAVDNTDPQPAIVKVDGPSMGAMIEVGSATVKYKAVDSDGNESPECFIELRVEEKVCGHPGDSFESSFLQFNCSMSGYVYGVSCILSCLAHLPLNGTDQITCEDNGGSKGVWDWGTGEKPFCREIACPELDPPINGALVYDTILTRPVYTMLCNDKFDIPSTGSNFDGKFFCNDDGSWNPYNSVLHCIEPRNPRFLNLPAEIFYYGGDCGTEETMAQIKENFQVIIEDYLKPYLESICPPGETCTADNIVIKCGPIHNIKKKAIFWKYKTEDILRKKRYDGENTKIHDVEKRQAETHLLTLEFYIVSEMNLDNTTLQAATTKYDEIQLNILKPAIQEMVTNGTFNIDGFALKSESFQTANYGDFRCDAGYLLVGTQCEPCPLGYFLNDTTKTCDICLIGQYKGQESGSTCTICPHGYSTKHNSSKSQDECFKLCSPGSYSPDTVENCSPCLQGYYQDEYGQTSCKVCPAGTTTESKNSSTVDDCKSYNVLLEDTNGDVTFSTIPATMSSITFMLWSKRLDDQHTNAELRLTNDGADLINVFLTENIRIEIPPQVNEIVGLHSSSAWTHVAVTWDTSINRITIYKGGATVYTSGYVTAPSVPLLKDAAFIVKSSGQSAYLTGFHLLADVLTEVEIANHSGSCYKTENEFVINTDVFLAKQDVSIIVSADCDAKDECLPSPCNGHVCRDGQDDFTCTCLGGWSGTTCTILPDFCIDNACENGAICYSGNSSYACTCAPGYGGSLCEVPPVNGGWSEWSLWPECSQSCRSGTQSRTRACDSPSPDTYGSDCVGSSTETTLCNTEDCPVCKDFEANIGTRLTCTTHHVTGSKTCEVYCEEGKFLPPGSSDFQTFTCGPDTNYAWDSMDNLPSCVEPVSPRDASITVTLDYTSSIADSSKQSVLDAIHGNLEATPCHASANCDTQVSITESSCNGQGACSSVNVIFSMPLLLGPDLQYDSYVSNDTGMSDALQELNDAILILESTAAYTQNYTSEIFDVTTNDVTVTANQDSRTLEALITCDIGYVEQDGFCLQCPAGTYSANGVCNFCEKGTYQTSGGMTSCLKCPSGLTTKTIGSSSKSQCTDQEIGSTSTVSFTSFPDHHDDDDKKIMYIAIAMAAVALVIAVFTLAIVWFKKIRPRLKLNVTVADSRRNTMPSKQLPSSNMFRQMSSPTPTVTGPDLISIHECDDFDYVNGSDDVRTPDIRSLYVRGLSRISVQSSASVMNNNTPPSPYKSV